MFVEVTGGDARGSGGEASRRERRLVGRGGSHDVVVGVDVADVAVGGPLARPRLLPPEGGSVVVGSPLLPPRLPLVGSGLSGPAPTGACRRSDRLLCLLVRPRSGPA